jgi:electron transfer flavoprotein beta subunit
MVLNAEGTALETRHLGFTMSPHEECGVEEAVRLIESGGGESVTLTLGPAEAVEQLRDAMALGVDRGILLQTDGQEWDGEATAAAITEAIKADEAASGPFDLIFFGNESADSGGYQVGLRVAYALGRPCATGLKGVKVEGASVRCEQDAGGGRDVYALPLPAVVTVKEGLNLPRYPSVPGRMRASRKPVVTSTPARPESRLKMTRLAVPGGSGRRAESLGKGAAAAPAVVEMMKRTGIL